MSLFLVGHFVFSNKKNFFSNKNNHGFHMSYHFFRNFDDYPSFQPKTTFLYYFAHDCYRQHHVKIQNQLSEFFQIERNNNDKRQAYLKRFLALCLVTQKNLP